MGVWDDQAGRTPLYRFQDSGLQRLGKSGMHGACFLLFALKCLKVV